MHRGITVLLRFLALSCRYTMIKHGVDAGNPRSVVRQKLLDEWESRQPTDGLNSLDIEITKVVRFITHTRLYIKTKTPYYKKSASLKPKKSKSNEKFEFTFYKPNSPDQKVLPKKGESSKITA